MHRQNYEAIAQAIKDELSIAEGMFLPSDRHIRQATIYNIADRIADVMEADNPRFDREVFLTACGFPE